ncbi:Hsp70 family protein [Catenuloplanes sp. NPDC051500]|uniref:Hsp70 family protein n=1 Tax=Catenuloplanes sp. NPDC051500 TaxID=3363959 RepID=UPI00378D3D5A
MQLAIDFGTASTVTMFGEPPRPLVLDSAVGVTAEGGMLTGPEAAASAPESVDRHPKLRVGDGVIRAGGRELPAAYTVGAILHRAGAEVTRAVGGEDRAVTLTHPAAWGPAQLSTLTEAATWAGFATVRLVPEPVAAAALRQVPPGQCLAVYDLGAGTFDIAVVRSGELVASAGLSDVSGLHLDAIVVGMARRASASAAPDVWARLERPQTTDDRRAQVRLWESARVVREQLSVQGSALMQVPMLGAPVEIGRAQFEAEATPLLERTVALTRETLQRASVPVAGLLLAGGVCRTPLVASLLHRALGITPVLTERPELVVAQGALALGWPAATQPAPTPEQSAPGPVPPVAPHQPAGPHWGAPAPASAPWQSAPPAMAPWQSATIPAPGYPRVEPVEIAIDGAAGITLRWIERELDGDGSGGTHEEPRFLAADGRVQIFDTAAGLVAYLHSDAAHDLRHRPGWPEYLRWVSPPVLFPAPEHRYELDLVADNLAAGRDSWIPELILGAGVIARDLAYALHLDVWTLLAPGSLLDELDEALRRQNRWKLRGLDAARLAEHWRQVVDELEDAVAHQP